MKLERKLKQREQLGNLRKLSAISGLIDFASNDYLGLSRNTCLPQMVLNEHHGLGSTGSRLLTGNSQYAEELEQAIANFHGYPSALLFSCGYMANVGLISSVADATDVILYDTHIHASMHDGIKLSRATAYPVRHNDPFHLEKRLKKHQKRNVFVCIEAIYSTDGSQAPVQEICALCNQYRAYLIVDEAHAVGVTGPEGRGLLAKLDLTDQTFAQVTTFGKALGTYGAVVLGGALLKEYLINFARSCIYTTALPPYALAAIKGAYQILPKLKREREYLDTLICQFQNAFSTKSFSPIQPIRIKGNKAVKELSDELAKEGFDIRPLMSPTVRKGHEVLRVCLHAYNTAEEVAALIQYIKEKHG